MTDRSIGPRCGNNPNVQLTAGDRKAVDDFKARLALKEAAKPYIERAVWEDGDPLMEVIAATLWGHCARDSEEMPQLVCDDPRTIAAFAAAVARAHAAVPAPATDQAALRARLVLALDTAFHAFVSPLSDAGEGLELSEHLADAVLPVLPAPTDRAAEAALKRVREYLEARLDQVAVDPAEVFNILTGATEPPLSPYYSHQACGFHWHGRDGMDIPTRDGEPVCPRCELRRMADEARDSKQQDGAATLAAVFEGFGRLLATSSRDWGQYAPDAWLYAVILGWDCEETEHDDTCTHGAMEEMQQQHGWSDDAVAKARRYRAAVRALTEPAAEAQQDGAARRCAHTDIVYGRCILPMPGHDDRECFHEKQPARVNEQTDEDTLCSSEYPGDGNFVGQLCALPKDHFGEHRCDETFAGVAYTAQLGWANEQQPKEA